MRSDVAALTALVLAAAEPPVVASLSLPATVTVGRAGSLDGSAHLELALGCVSSASAVVLRVFRGRGAGEVSDPAYVGTVALVGDGCEPRRVALPLESDDLTASWSAVTVVLVPLREAGGATSPASVEVAAATIRWMPAP